MLNLLPIYNDNGVATTEKNAVKMLNLLPIYNGFQNVVEF